MNNTHDTINRAVKTLITCDNCHLSYSAEGCYSITDLKRLLKANGWSFGKYIKCPDCRKKRRTDNGKL